MSKKIEEKTNIKVRLLNDKTMDGEVSSITPVAVSIITHGTEYTIPWSSILYTSQEVPKI